MAWNLNPSTDSAVGYMVHLGTQSQVYSTSFDAGNVDTFTTPLIDPAQTYYLAVSAYSADRVMSALSAEVTRVPAPMPPPLPQPPPVCTSATQPVVTVRAYANRVNLGQAGQIDFSVSSPANRRIVQTYLEWGTTRWSTLSSPSGVEASSGLFYNTSVRGSNILTTYAVDELGCVGRTSRTRTVQVR